MDMLAVFQTRNDALRVSRFLREKGIACSIVSTPASLKMGCGLSIVASSSVKGAIDAAIAGIKATSFRGYFVRK
ncbi:MAG: DUF3343 domain-containing protein [Clostridia bacterium]|nr:DUF3343 domain-containing protein [Clostridia bacterium]